MDLAEWGHPSQAGVSQMSFRFSLDKATEAAAYLLRLEPAQEMTYIRLLKLLYLADRRSLRETGRPITGDRVVAMRHGPVLSNVYDCMKGSFFGQSRWDEHFVSVGFCVQLRRSPDIRHLSRKEIAILDQVQREHEGKNEWEIVEETHALEEWSDPGPDAKVEDIPFEKILKAVGRGEQAAQILEDARAEATMDRILDMARKATASSSAVPAETRE
ncbi:MAG: Panacea domain-containing protein [Phycisphaerae bacterium]